ncbi:bifunctional DNA primase/polymerase, partial [Planktothrix sp.]|uniref:bifunctional DNA primase/polymerase n=1 Tax=Planktothrix sp. TaxID=3088171 RepID=UPI0038D3BFB6
MNTTKTSTQNLIAAIETFPSEWELTPVFNKAPKIKNWQKGIDRETIIKELETGRANGIGLITGELSGHLLALDIDGPEADKLAEERGGIPHTVKWTSQKPGRYQCLLFVPPEYQDLLKDLTRKVIPTGVKGEQLEIRYKGCQSVLWLSEHPETPGYIVINGLDTPIAEVPVWVIEQILGDNSQLSNPDQFPLNFDNNINNSITPLYNFLSRDDRKLIDNGVLNGSRNDSGAKLSRGLLGAVNRLNYLGYQFDGNPEDLFNTFCDKCNPPLPQKERQTIWKSA